MPNTTLEQRRAAIAQQKARLADRERKLQNDLRKARTRQLIECGGLVAKAGLSDLPTNALYGALLTLKAASGDPLQVKRWSADGGAAFNRENRDKTPEIMAAAE